jgi:hypothetical protein
LPGVCALSRWHSPRRPCPLWAAVRSPVASPLRLPRARTARWSHTLVRVMGSAVAAPRGPAQQLAGYAPASHRPLLSRVTCSLSGPCCSVVLGPQGSFSPWRGCKNINPFFFFEIKFKTDSNFQNSYQIHLLSKIFEINSVIHRNSIFIQEKYKTQ